MPVIVEYKTQKVVCALHNPETNVLKAELSWSFYSWSLVLREKLNVRGQVLNTGLHLHLFLT